VSIASRRLVFQRFGLALHGVARGAPASVDAKLSTMGRTARHAALNSQVTTTRAAIAKTATCFQVT